MSTLTHRQSGGALLMLLLLVLSTTIPGWSKSLNPLIASEAHINEVTLGTDKKMTDPTDEFESDETIFAVVEIADNEKTVKVNGRLHVVEIAGQKSGPIPATETNLTVAGDGTAGFIFSPPD